jgi:hypothetical protein
MKKPSAETELRNLKARYKREGELTREEVRRLRKEVEELLIENKHLRQMVDLAKRFTAVIEAMK